MGDEKAKSVEAIVRKICTLAGFKKADKKSAGDLGEASQYLRNLIVRWQRDGPPQRLHQNVERVGSSEECMDCGDRQFWNWEIEERGETLATKPCLYPTKKRPSYPLNKKKEEGGQGEEDERERNAS